MIDLHEIDIFTPTASDNMTNRLKEFMTYGTIQFMQTAATQILISFDKNNVKAKVKEDGAKRKS